MSFEKDYYEAARFWEEGALDDAGNRERIELTIGLLPTDVESLLDVGCGNGIFLNALQRTRGNMRLLGVDRSGEALRYVKTAKEPGDITQLRQQNRSYDCVSCLEVLEHLPVPVYERALSELARVARQYLLVSVPFEENLDDGMTTCPACGSRFNANLHLRSYSKDEFRGMFRLLGFDCVATAHAGASRQFRFHREYRRLFYPNAGRKWLSPLCPICGYSNSRADIRTIDVSRPRTNRTWLSALKSVPKLFWPKETRYYWILGLFRRADPVRVSAE